MAALAMALHYANTLPTLPANQPVYTQIYIDLLQSIKKLSQLHTTSGLSTFIVLARNYLLQRHHAAKIMWIPGHVEMMSNE